MTPLSILDQSSVAEGRTPAEAIRETIALAEAAEAMGYGRYWLAEHHNSLAHAGAAPEIVMAAIGARTRRIRIGSAGIMLPHYASLKVAEVARALEAVAPGRIDLGLGRAPGSDGMTALALNPLAREAADRFPQQVAELMGWLGEGLPANHPFARIVANPVGPTRPEIWILGSSSYGAQVAAHFGLPYAFAQFITDAGAEDAIGLYRGRFKPSPWLAEPRAAVAVFALAASSDAEARHHAASRLLWRLWRDRGIYAPLPTPDRALAEIAALSAPERAFLERLGGDAFIGTGAAVQARLAEFAAQCGADEIAVLTPCHDPAARRASYAALAEASGLARAA
ncbi:LLM class flavin-dependent oxidoreductase [Elioraea rosea]|uniref:LLM class flavin-dependent oxidoreductase n=1 Tax=Elioraea rosea TaxID=2492390 RepID=UPI001182F8D1|nr:LLM class flavin-dependent oxidoreductase [Elioraea rosea]